MHCDLETLVRFDRKNYYYSDLPKGFQITQQFHPIGTNGYVEIDVDGKKKQIRIERIHMEEDTAKQFHKETGTYIDFNRAGTPLKTEAAFRAAGRDVYRTLAANDAYHALQAVGGLIRTGATGTNVNDVAVALVE